MPLDASTIARHRQAVASKDRHSALQYISALEPIVTVPIIIAIIQDALIKVPAESGTEEMRAFFAYARDLLLDVHAKQNASAIKLPAILKEYTKEKITRELNELINKVELIKMHPALLEISKEAEIWLEGWHLRTFNMAEKDKNGNPLKDDNGVFKRIDTQDTFFYKIVGMTKLEIATYYGKVAASFRIKIRNYQNEIEQRQKEKTPENNTAKIDVVIKDGVAVISMNVSALDVTLIEKIKQAMMSATLPQRDMLPAVEAPKGVITNIDESGFVIFLKNFSSDNEDIKIQMLEYVLNLYGLTDTQKNMLENLKVNIIAKLDSYANDPYVVPLTKVPLPGGIFVRTHKKFVDEKKNAIFSTNDPKELLIILFDMRTTLIGRCSDDLLKKVNILILDAYTMLEHAPVARMAARMSM